MTELAFVPASTAGEAEAVAKELLDKAAAAGLPASVVRSVGGGFYVPASLIETVEADEPAKVEAPRKAATRRKASADG